MRRLQILNRSALFCGCLAVLASCGQPAPEDESQAAAPEATVKVRVESVLVAPVERTVTAYGITDALRREKILAPMAGRIVALSAFEGTAVHRGDVLAVMLKRESQAALLGAQNMVRSAKTPAERANAERMLALAQSSQQRVSLMASFDGIVATRAVSEGELVGENQQLYSIVDPSTVVMLADIPLRDIASVQVGARARVTFPALGEEVFPARVDALSPQAMDEGQTVRARLAFGPLPDKLRSLLRTNMAGTVVIVTGTIPRALVIPRTALVRNDEDNTYSVVTITADSLAIHLPVEVGVFEDSTVQISGGGITPGLDVITEGNYALADSTRVTVAGDTAR